MGAGRIVVTGASGSIGAAIASAISTPGCHIALHYHMHPERLSALAQGLGSRGALVEPVAADLSDLSAVDSFAQEIRSRIGPPQFLVHAAGMSQFALLQNLTLSEWRKIQDLHLGAAYRLLAQFLPDMIRDGFGRVVLVGSIFGQRGGAMESSYAAAKAGLAAIARSLGGEVARSGITVNVVAPGAIATPMLSRLSAAERSELSARIPAGRIGTPDDVANAVQYLLSEDARYLSGVVLPVDGGYSM